MSTQLAQGGTTRGQNLTQPIRYTYNQPSYSVNRPGLAQINSSSLFGTAQGAYDGPTLEGPSMKSGATDGFYDYDAGQIAGGTPETTGPLGVGGDFNFGQTMGTVNGIMDIGMTGMNMWNLYKGNQYRDEMLGFARDQNSRAGEQWNLTKNELGRIAAVRQNLTAGYANGGNYVEQERNNPSETAAAISTAPRLS